MLYGVSAFTLFHSGKLLCVWAEGEFQFLRGERVWRGLQSRINTCSPDMKSTNLPDSLQYWCCSVDSSLVAYSMFAVKLDEEHKAAWTDWSLLCGAFTFVLLTRTLVRLLYDFMATNRGPQSVVAYKQKHHHFSSFSVYHCIMPPNSGEFWPKVLLVWLLEHVSSFITLYIFCWLHNQQIVFGCNV